MMRLTRTCLLEVLFTIMVLRRRLANRVLVHFFRQHNRYRILQGDLSSLRARVLVLVARSESASLASLERAILPFKQSGFGVLLIINDSVTQVPDWSKSLFADVIISRPNVGRDFGAYRVAFRVLRMNSNLTHVVLLNDSLFFLPKSDALLFLRDHEGPWGCLTWNQHPSPHAQSFALSFKSEVLHSSYFQTYWNHFYPSNLRSVAIKKGEIGLSKALLRAQVSPSVYFDFLRFRNIDWRSLTSEEMRHIDAQLQHYAANHSRPLSRSFELVINDLFQNSNPVHSMGLILARQLSVPLKLDLVRKGGTNIPGFIDTLLVAGVSIRESKEVESRLRTQKLYSSMNVLSRFLAERR